MTFLALFFSLLTMLFLSSCQTQEEEQEADYHDMAMEEAEEAEWTTGQEPHIAGDLVPDPQERMILEQAEQGAAVR